MGRTKLYPPSDWPSGVYVHVVSPALVEHDSAARATPTSASRQVNSATRAIASHDALDSGARRREARNNAQAAVNTCNTACLRVNVTHRTIGAARADLDIAAGHDQARQSGGSAGENVTQEPQARLQIVDLALANVDAQPRRALRCRSGCRRGRWCRDMALDARCAEQETKDLGRAVRRRGLRADCLRLLLGLALSTASLAWSETRRSCGSRLYVSSRAVRSSCVSVP